MNKLFVIAFFVLCANYLSAQVQIFIDVSSDTVALSEVIELRYTMKGTQGDFIAPQIFENTQLLSGPNQSSSMSSINGVLKQEMSISYFLRAQDLGDISISAGGFVAGDTRYEFPKVNIFVSPEERLSQMNGSIRLYSSSGSGEIFQQKKKKFVKL